MKNDLNIKGQELEDKEIVKTDNVVLPTDADFEDGIYNIYVENKS